MFNDAKQSKTLSCSTIKIKKMFLTIFHLQVNSPIFHIITGTNIVKINSNIIMGFTFLPSINKPMGLFLENFLIISQSTSVPKYVKIYIDSCKSLSRECIPGVTSDGLDTW